MTDTKNRILLSGLTIFLDNGYSGASISMIADDAGISKSTLFHHFASKEELFNEIFLMCKEVYSQNNNYDDLLSDNSYELIKNMYAFSMKYKKELMFMTKFENSSYITDESREKGISMNKVFYHYILNGQKEGRIINLPPIFICLFMANAIITSMDYVLDNGVIQEEALNKIVKFITNSIKSID